MAASKRPSFLKRQKEQARLARATEKREARRARKHNKANAAALRDAALQENDLTDLPEDGGAAGEETDENPSGL